MRETTVPHEVGHAVSHYLFDAAVPGSSLAKLRGWWEILWHASRQFVDEADSVLSGALKITHKERAAVKDWRKIEYKLRPEEIFARAFQRAADEGMTFREATKISALAVHTTIKKSENALSRATKAVREASKRSAARERLPKILEEIEQEVGSVNRWFDDPEYRKGLQMWNLQNVFKKQNPNYTWKELNEFRDLLRMQSPEKINSLWERHWNPSRDITKEMAK